MMTANIQPAPERPLRIGTRRSPLAMAQANMVAQSICNAHGWPQESVQIIPMLSGGDKIQDRPLAEIGGKALWTKELERALLSEEIDIAVHSMKDVETLRPDAFAIAAMLPRADVRDRLIGADRIVELPRGARLGTSSPRRAAQMRALRPDLQIVSLRGNVATRLAKIEAGEADATLLAAAGLDRLNMADVGTAIEVEEMLPAASQGAIGIDCLADNKVVFAICDTVNHRQSFDTVMVERAFLKALNGDCHSPVAAHAVYDGANILLRGEIIREDGSERRAGSCHISADDMPDGFSTASSTDLSAVTRLAGQLLDSASAELKALFTA